MLLMDGDGRRAVAPRLAARRGQRQVPLRGRPRRSADARGHAGPRRGALARLNAVASIDGNVAAEAELVMGLDGRRTRGPRKAESTRPPSSIRGAQIGAGTVIGPYVTIGEHVTHRPRLPDRRVVASSTA